MGISKYPFHPLSLSWFMVFFCPKKAMKKLMIHFLLISTFLIDSSFSQAAHIKSGFEVPFKYTGFHTCFNVANPLGHANFNMEERQMIAEVKDNSSDQQSSAKIIIYSIDGLDELGPFPVIEGGLLKVDIDEREWNLRVVEQTEGSEVSWWIE